MEAEERGTVNVDQAAQNLGVNRLTLYSAIRNGESPVPVIKIGKRLVIPRAALDRLLSGDEPSNVVELHRDPQAAAP